MTRGMRLLMMILILIAVVVGMTQCMQKTMHKRKPAVQDGRAPMPLLHLAAGTIPSPTETETGS